MLFKTELYNVWWPVYLALFHRFTVIGHLDFFLLSAETFTHQISVFLLLVLGGLYLFWIKVLYLDTCTVKSSSFCWVLCNPMFSVSWRLILLFLMQFSALSHVQLFATPWTAAHQASLTITNSQNLLKFMSIESVIPSNHLILCYPLLLLNSIFSSIRVFSNESVLCIRWPKYWSFSFSISPSNDYPGLISFRIDWLDLLAVQGTLKSLLQHFNLEWFKSIDSSVLSFVYGLNLTSIHDHWKNHSFD